MFGPYGYNGSSYFNLVQTQARHIVRCLRHARAHGATMIEVTAEANDRYFAEMLRRRGLTASAINAERARWPAAGSR